MTINTDYNIETYISDGAITSYDFSFQVFSEDDIIITIQDLDNNTETLSLSSDYTISLNDDKTGTVNLLTAPTIDYKIYITREVDFKQEKNYETSSGFQAKVIEDSFDRLTVLTQQLKELADRTVKLTQFSEGFNVDLTIPNPEENKTIKWSYDSDTDTYSRINSTYDPDTVGEQVETFRDETETFRDETEVFRDEVETIANDIEGYPIWKTTVEYSLNTVINYFGFLYRSLQDSNLNNTPDTSPAYWQLLVDNRLVNAINNNYIEGFIPQSNDTTPDTDIDITEGSALCKDLQTFVYCPNETINLETILGTPLVADTTYHLYRYLDSSDVNQWHLDTSLTPTITGIKSANAYRRIFSFVTDGDGDIIHFQNQNMQGGYRLIYKTEILTLSTTQTTTLSNLTLTVPTGFSLDVLFRVNLTDSSDSGDVGGKYYDWGNDYTIPSDLYGYDITSSPSNQGYLASEFVRKTSTSGQIKYVNQDTISYGQRFYTKGFIDYRLNN